MAYLQDTTVHGGLFVSTNFTTGSWATIGSNLTVNGHINYLTPNGTGGFYLQSGTEGNATTYGSLRITTVGSASDVGVGRLSLGNNLSSGNRVMGEIYIYGNAANYFRILATDVTTNITLQATATRLQLNKNLTVTSGGITISGGGLTVSSGGLTVSSGGFALSGGGTISGTITGGITVSGSTTIASVTMANGNITTNGTICAGQDDTSGILIWAGKNGTATGNVDIASYSNGHNLRLRCGARYSGIFSSQYNKNLIYYDNVNNTVTVNSTSDLRLKVIEGTLNEKETTTILSEVPVYNFHYRKEMNGPKCDESNLHTGLIAQELRDVLIKNNFENKNYIYMNYTNLEDPDDYQETLDITENEDIIQYSIDYSKLVPLLWHGWQINNNRIKELEQKIIELGGEV